MITIKDVAKYAGVSICTVSRTLAGKENIREETRQRVFSAVEALNYTPNASAISLKTGKAPVLALILPSLTNVYYPKLEKYIELYAAQKGYMVYLCNSEQSLTKEKNILKIISSYNASGVIITPCSHEHSHIMNLEQKGIPYVYLNRTYSDDLKHCLRINNEQAAYNAVSYLIKQGHTSIGGIFENFENMSNEERYHGMIRALTDHNIPVRDDLILLNIDNPKTAVEQLQPLFQSAKAPTAFFACNDMLALSIYQTAYKLGLCIPQDLSVMGYDNTILAEMLIPPLSSFDTPAQQLSQTAIDFIDTYIQTGCIKPLPIIEGKLIIRESVAHPRMCCD